MTSLRLNSPLYIDIFSSCCLVFVRRMSYVPSAITILVSRPKCERWSIFPTSWASVGAAHIPSIGLYVWEFSFWPLEDHEAIRQSRPRRQKRQVAPVKFTNLWITSRMRGDWRRLHQIGKRCRDAHGRACTSLSRQKRRGIYASTSAWQSLWREVRVDFTLGEPASRKTVNVRGYKVKHNKIK